MNTVIAPAQLCAAGTACRGWDASTRTPAQRDTGPLCRAELAAGERDMRALLLDYRDLENYLPPALGVWGDGMPRADNEHKIPMRLDIEAIQAEIYSTVTFWERPVRGHARLSPQPQRVRRGWAVQAAVTVLAPRMGLLAQVQVGEQDGWQAVLDISRLHAKARHALLLTPVVPELIEGVPCKSCDVRSVLYREIGENTIRCGYCGLRYTADEYRDWCKLVASRYGRSG